MPRIAVVFEFPSLNGGEHSMLAIFDQLNKSEFEFVAIAPPTGRLADAFKERNIEHVPLELRDGNGERLPQSQAHEQLIAAIAKAGPDIVHANSLAMGRLTGAVHDKITQPTIAHLRDIINLSQSAIDDLNKNDILVAVSHATRRHHVDQGLDAERTGVVYNGIDLKQFKPEVQSGVLKDEFGIDPDGFLVLTIGQIALRKGHDVLAKAAIEVCTELEDVHFLIVGERHSNKPESIDFEAQIETTFADAGHADRLHRVSYCEDVGFLMAECDLLVHPAKQEPLGRVLLEAAACELPIIATDVGGTAEIVTHEDSALLVPPSDSTALRNAILQAYDEEEERLDFADAARNRVKMLFSIERASRALQEVWEAALS
ncbi:MAG: hypothetical protein CMJ78_11365 [Planctomycetaceae bacterium]|nr:hypothetical protein [Planctomycetaceae bacterium]